MVLQSEFADDLPPVTGDRVQLQQVILNLLRNASDAMVDVDDRPRQLLIRTEREADDRVRLTVRDAGVGLDRSEHEQAVRCLLHDEDRRHGYRALRQSLDHRETSWASLGGADDGPGATFSFAIPAAPETVPGAIDTKV